MTDDLYALGTGGAFIELKDAVSELDVLLSAGGPLPSPWTPAGPQRVAQSIGAAGGEVPEFDKPESERTALDELQWYRGYARAVRSEGAKQVAVSVIANALDAAFRALADKDAEISRLTAELDAARNVPVEYVITAGLEAAMAADPHREDGSVLRETDGAKRAFAWRAATRTWEQAQ
jgi:hypothetical protein